MSAARNAFSFGRNLATNPHISSHWNVTGRLLGQPQCLGQKHGGRVSTKTIGAASSRPRLLSMTEKCGDCRFYCNSGECRLKPPHPKHGCPVVETTHWCGEFQPKEKDYGDEAEEAREADAEAASEAGLLNSAFSIAYDSANECWRIYSLDEDRLIGGEFDFKPQAEDWLRRYVGSNERKVPRW